MLRRRSGSGQTATEYMLLISVIVIGVTAAAYVYVPTFQNGVSRLATDVSTILATGRVGGIGISRDGGGNGPMVGTHVLGQPPIGGIHPMGVPMSGSPVYNQAPGGSAAAPLGAPQQPAPITGGPVVGAHAMEQHRAGAP